MTYSSHDVPGTTRDVYRVAIDAALKRCMPLHFSAGMGLVNAEAGTISWFAIQEGPSSFAIFDTFDDEARRNAHLNGRVAAALMEKAKAGDLFEKAPEIHKIDILADKLPKKR
jgi:quinol monooxygenase YgiN